jgi:hypothetical protein
MQAQSLATLRDRVAALRAPACGMAHESVTAGGDGLPVPSSVSDSGYARAGICPASVRARHLGCSHTMARYVLRDALAGVSGAQAEPLLAELGELEQAIGVLDHRRYDAETRRANALTSAGDVAGPEREIAALVAEHQSYVDRAVRLRDAILRLLDGALAEGRQSGKGE